MLAIVITTNLHCYTTARTRERRQQNGIIFKAGQKTFIRCHFQKDYSTELSVLLWLP